MHKTFVGNPCKKCGGTERYLSGNNGCVECAKRNSQMRWKSGKTQEWVEKNRDIVNSSNKKRYNSLSHEEKKLRIRKQHVATYGLTLEQYDMMLEKQNGVCAICGKGGSHSHHKNLCIDHDHETGEVRGLLCDLCNKGIGCLKDDLDLLKSAVLYLEKYS
jgi:hypothetical protein